MAGDVADPINAGVQVGAKGGEGVGAELLEQIGDALICVDKELRVTYWGPGAEVLYGVPRAAALGRPIQDSYHWEWLGADDEEVARLALDQQGWWRGRNINVLCSGARLVVESTVTVLRGRDGQRTGVLAVIRDCSAAAQADQDLARDMTEQRALVRRLDAAREEARRTAAELQSVLDAVPAAVFIARDSESLRIDSNRFGAALLGAPRGANVSLSAPEGQAPRGFRCVRNGVALRPEQLPVQVSARSGQPVRDFDYDIVFDDGSVRHMLANVEPLFDEGGRPCGAVSAVIDITDRKRADDAVTRARDEIVAVVSHELRNPLNAMASSVEVLRSALRADREPRAEAEAGAGERLVARERADNALRMLARNVNVQQRLVEDLLDVTRAARGTLVARRAPVGVDELVASATQPFAQEALARGIGLEVLCDAGVQVFGDPERLQQVLANLLSNAMKFTPDGGAILVAAEADGETARIRVADSGIGLARSQMDTLFDMFQQGTIAVAGTGRRGLGIGLGLVKAIVDQHGGRVRAESDGPGTGSRFIVELPVHSGRSGGQRAGSGRAPAGDTPARTPARLLVAMDDADTRAFLVATLEAHGYAVVATSWGEPLWQAMRSVAIDAVIIDAAAAVDAGAREPSPGGGLQVVRRLRESPGRAELPVLALGGFARDASVPPRLGAGFSAYLAKPVDVGTLHAALEECLARAAARGPSR